MRCAYPVSKERKVSGSSYRYEHRCGQCAPCRITQRQEKTARALLEIDTGQHQAVFVTLTYEDPPTTEDGSQTLERDAMQAFAKRLRKNTGLDLRMFGSAEYGEKGGRPHYHLIIWPLSLEYHRPGARITGDLLQSAQRQRARHQYWTDSEHEIYRAWQGRGHTQVKEGIMQAIRYTAGYVLKKMQAPERTDGTVPEHTYFPRRPGLGAPAAKPLADLLKAHRCYPEGRPDLKPGPGWKPVTIRKVDYSTRIVREPGEDLAEFGGQRKAEKRKPEYLPLDRFMQEKIALEYGADKRTDATKAWRPDWSATVRRYALVEGIITLQNEVTEREAAQVEGLRKAAIAKRSRSL